MATTLQQHKKNLAVTAKNLEKNFIHACNIIAKELNKKGRTDLLIFKNGTIKTLNSSKEENEEEILTSRVVITMKDKKLFREKLSKNFKFEYTDTKVSEIFWKIINTLKNESNEI